MIAELNVYGNPSSLEPTKVYTVYRLTPYTKGLVQDFLTKRFKPEELNADDDKLKDIVKEKYEDEEEMWKDIYRLLQIFFPEITEQEMSMLDFGDGSGNNGQFFEFVNTLSAYGDAEDLRAAKN